MMTSETLLGLVQLYSPSGQEEGAVRWLVQRMDSLGYDSAFMDEVGNAVGLRGQGPQQIILLGHIDTVPDEIPLRVENDVLYGRGAVDAKGPLACFVDAATQVTVPAGWQIVVIGAVGEESDSRGAYFVRDHYQPAYALIGEPNHWHRVALGYKGSVQVEVTVRQEVQHSAAAGQTASEVGVELWQKITDFTRQYNAEKIKLFEQLQPSLLGFQSGQESFTSWARLRVNTRLPLSFSSRQWLSELSALAAGAEVNVVGNPIEAWVCEKNTPPVRAFLASIREQGESPAFVYKTGTADLNIVAPAWNCPALVYGPGDSTLDHTPEEHLSLQEYERAVTVVKEALTRLMK